MVTPERLKEVTSLKNLGAKHLGQIAEIVRLEEYREGTVLFRQGQDWPFIYFILSGEFALFEESGNDSVEIARIGAGELLGWSPVLENRAMTATARALTDGQLAVLDAKSLIELSERDPNFGMAFMRQIALIISERLWSARRNLARLKRHRPILGSNPEGSD